MGDMLETTPRPFEATVNKTNKTPLFMVLIVLLWKRLITNELQAKNQNGCKYGVEERTK